MSLYIIKFRVWTSTLCGSRPASWCKKSSIKKYSWVHRRRSRRRTPYIFSCPPSQGWRFTLPSVKRAKLKRMFVYLLAQKLPRTRNKHIFVLIMIPRDHDQNDPFGVVEKKSLRGLRATLSRLASPEVIIKGLSLIYINGSDYIFIPTYT